MRTERLKRTAHNIIERLIPAEVSLTEAFIGNAELQAALGRAKLENAVGLAFGHGVLSDLQRAQAAILDATSRTIRAHKGLDLLRERAGLPEIATGSGAPKEDIPWEPTGELADRAITETGPPTVTA